MVRYDFIDWDDPDDPKGNDHNIAENGVTVAEFMEILESRQAGSGISRTSGRPTRYGWTSTGKHIVITYVIEDDGGFVIVRPVTAFETEPPA
ncbi:MAG: hypothetical protein AB7I30_13735 [Isosphaeraceae bacterium]